MKYALQCTDKCSGFSSCIAILCVYDERRTRCKSRDACPDIPIWLTNEVSSHSNIGHCWKRHKSSWQNRHILPLGRNYRRTGRYFDCSETFFHPAEHLRHTPWSRYSYTGSWSSSCPARSDRSHTIAWRSRESGVVLLLLQPWHLEKSWCMKYHHKNRTR